MTERRGTRSRTTSESLKTAPLGSPDESGDESLSDDGGTQDSSSSRMRGGNTNNGTRTEHPDASSDPDMGDDAADSSHSPNGFTAEESAEWKELLNLRKGKQHADKKITEQGQENSQLRTERDELQSRVGRMERTLAQILSSQGANTESSAADFGGDFGGDSEDTADPNDLQVMQRVVGRLFAEQKKGNEAFAQFREDHEYEKDVSHLMQNLGVNREGAEVLIDVFQNGDILDFAKAYELSSLPAEARATARDARQRQRNAVAHPTSTTNAPFAPASEDDMSARRARGEKLMKMRDGKSKRDAITKALDEDPDMFPVLAEMSGFNFL